MKTSHKNKGLSVTLQISGVGRIWQLAVQLIIIMEPWIKIFKRTLGLA